MVSVLLSLAKHAAFKTNPEATILFIAWRPVISSDTLQNSTDPNEGYVKWLKIQLLTRQKRVHSPIAC